MESTKTDSRVNETVADMHRMFRGFVISLALSLLIWAAIGWAVVQLLSS